jgi:hypothetical protein
MSDTPFDDDINGLALEGILRALDRAINRKHDLENAEPCTGDEDLKRLMAEERERKERFEQPVQADDIRLRKYNEEWIKNKIHNPQPE